MSTKLQMKMQELGMTQYRLAKASGVPQASVASIMHGDTKNPGTLTMRKLAKALDCELEEICEELPPRNDDEEAS